METHRKARNEAWLRCNDLVVCSCEVRGEQRAPHAQPRRRAAVLLLLRPLLAVPLATRRSDAACAPTTLLL